MGYFPLDGCLVGPVFPGVLSASDFLSTGLVGVFFTFMLGCLFEEFPASTRVTETDHTKRTY